MGRFPRRLRSPRQSLSVAVIRAVECWRTVWVLFGILVGVLFALPAWSLPPLQLYIQLTPPGGTLHLEPGRYGGPAVVDRPITIDGGGEAIVDGGGRGTVLTLRADGAVVRGLHLTGSGDSHDAVDAGVLVEANDTVVESNVIDDVLFGIHLKSAEGNVVRANRITSKRREMALRGDGIRMWYSRENLIEGNTLSEVRDMMVMNSPDNRLVGNTISGSGVGMEFVFSPDNEVESNTIDANGTGIVVLYSNGVKIRANRLSHMRSRAGAALAIKDSSQVEVEENEILHCAVGMEVNAPTHPENTMTLRRNRFAYNDIAMYFYGEKGGHTIEGNRFENNLLTVAVSAPTSARANHWQGNFWDEYQGFDQDRDGVGDTPYDLYIYADRIWIDRPMARLFRGSPVLEVIDFVERLAPFSVPELVLRDPAPLIR